MANNELNIKANLDVSALRKQVEGAFRNVPFTLSTASIAENNRLLKEKLVPKLNFEPDGNAIKSFAAKVRDGVGTIKVKIEAEDSKGFGSLRAELEKNLKNLRIEFDKGDLDKIRNAISANANVKLKFDTEEAYALKQKTEQYFRKNPIVIKTAYKSPSVEEIRKGASSGRGGRNGGNGPTTGVPGSGPNGDNLGKSMKDTGKSASDMSRDLNTTVQQLKEYEAATKRSATITNTFAERVGFTAGRLAAYLIPATAVFQLARGFGAAVTSIKDLNIETNKLTQILDGNATRAQAISDKVLSTAVKYGQSGKDLLQVTNTLAQAGEQFLGEGNTAGDRLQNVVEQLAKTDLASTFGDIKQTAEGAVAAINQFNLSGSDLGKVLDIANQLSKKFAFESDNLFEAVRNGGGAFALAGGDIKQFAATVSAARSITRLPSSVIGTAINTVAQKALRPDVVSYEEQLTKQVGGIRDANGNLLTLTDRWKQVAKATKSYTDEQLQPVVEKLADLRQGKFFIPLLRDLQKGGEGSVFIKNLQELEKAPGSLSRDTAIGLQRLDVQLASVGARFEQIFSKLSNDKGIQQLAKELAALGKGLADVLGVLSPMIPALARLAGIGLLGKIVTGVPGYIRGLRQVNKAPLPGLGQDPASLINVSSGSLEDIIAQAQKYSQTKNAGRTRFQRLFPAKMFTIDPAIIAQKSLERANRITNLENQKAALDAQAEIMSRTGVRRAAGIQNVKSTPKPASGPVVVPRNDAMAAYHAYIASQPAGTAEALEGRFNDALKAGFSGFFAPDGKISQITQARVDAFRGLAYSKGYSLSAPDFRPDAGTVLFHMLKTPQGQLRINPLGVPSGSKKGSIAAAAILGKRPPSQPDTVESRFLANLAKNPNIVSNAVGIEASGLNSPEIRRALIQQGRKNLENSKLSDLTASVRTSGTGPLNLVQAVLTAQRAIRKAPLGDDTLISKVTPAQKLQIQKKFFDNFGLQPSQSSLIKGASGADLYVAQRKTIYDAAKKYVEELKGQGLSQKEIQTAAKEYVAGIKTTVKQTINVGQAQKQVQEQINEQKRSLVQYNSGLQISLSSINGSAGQGSATVRKPAVIGPAIRGGFGKIGSGVKTALTSEAFASSVPSILALGGSFIFDKLASDAANGIRGLTDPNGNLLQNFDSIVSKNRSLAKKQGAFAGAGVGFGGGALLGGAIGSAFPGPGTIIGTLIGGLVGALGGGAAGYADASKKIKDSSVADLFQAASGGKTTRDSVKPLFSAFQLIEKDRGFSPVTNGGEFAKALRGVFKTEGGAAELAKLRERSGQVAAELFSQGKITDINDTGAAVRTQLTQEAFKAIKDEAKFRGENITDMKAMALASTFVTEGLRKLNGSTHELDESNKKAIENLKRTRDTRDATYQSIVSGNRSSLTEFASNIRSGNRSITTGTNIKEFNTFLQGQLGDTLLGKGSGFSIPTEFGNILGDALNEKLRASPDKRNVLRDVIAGNSGGLLDNKSVDIFADTALVQKRAEQAARSGLRGLSGLVLPAGEDNSGGRGAATILERFLNDNLLGELKTSEAKNEFRTKFQAAIQQVKQDPSLATGDPVKIAEDIVKEFANGVPFIERFNASIQAVNAELRKAEALYGQQREAQQRQIALEGQISSTSIDRIRNSASIGATTDDIVSALDQMINANNPIDNIRSSGKNALNAQNAKIGTFGSFAENVPEAAKDTADSLMNARKAQDEFNDELNRTTQYVAALRAKFDELTKHTSNLIGQNRTFGVTPLDQRFDLQAGAQIFDSTTGGLFQGKLGQAKNVQDLFRLLSPDEIKQAVSSFSGIGGTEPFIQGTQAAERLGGRFVDGTNGVTYGGRAEIAQFLSGASFNDPNGKNLDYLINEEKSRQATFEKMSNIEDEQLFYLKSINDALRENFGLPKANYAPIPNVFQGRQTPPTPSTPFIDHAFSKDPNVINKIADAASSTNSDITSVLDRLNSAIVDLTTKKDASGLTNIEAELNITGFDGVGKDVAVSSIVIAVMEKLAEQLGSDPAEQALKEKIKASVRSLKKG
jgi:TP901 family phage tail tape measure protein